MKLPELRIGDLMPKWPIIQGGMAVRISTAPLAAAVAEEGGIGLIAASGMSLEELKSEIARARELTKGIIGINIMYAASQFASLVKTAIDEGIDLIVSGAGFSRDIFTWGKSAGVPIVPIVSSDRLAKMAEKMGASAVIVEGKEAGGHLGTDVSVKELIPMVKKAVSIPVIAAGGIIDGKTIMEMFKLGADGVQMATRFVASKECNAADEFKQMYIDAKKEDVVLLQSPVGLPAQGIINPFLKRLFSGENLKPTSCENCLKKCSRTFCIIKALNRSQQGDTETGLVFCGERVGEIKEILSVKDIFKKLFKEMEEAESGV